MRSRKGFGFRRGNREISGRRSWGLDVRGAGKYSGGAFISRILQISKDTPHQNT